MPTPRQGHFDRLLSNLSVIYMQKAENFVADKVFPTVPVEKQSDLYLVFPRGAFWRDQVGKRPLGGQSPIADYGTGSATYYCEEEGLSTNLDDRERANATPPYDPEKTKVQFLTQQHLIHRDRLWANKYFKTGVWANEYAGVASAPTGSQLLQWNQANSTPIENIDTIKDAIAEQTGFQPNVLVLGRKVFRILKNHATVLDRIKYTQRGVVTAELLAQLFGVEKIVVPGGIQNTGAEGAADAFSFIIPSTHAMLAYAAPSPGLDQPSAGYNFTWNGLIPGGGLGAAVYRGREERAHSDWFEVRMAQDLRVVASDLGVFFNGIVG
jgi:hypothetical protein